jgi:hypothetical protein
LSESRMRAVTEKSYVIGEGPLTTTRVDEAK